MALSKKPYRGTRDFFPKDKRIQNYMFSHMENTAERFGYEPYDGPLLEEVELYKAKSGEELINDQIYSFNDRGERFVAIRPEMTPTLARMVAQIHKEEAKPIRWFSIPNLMRYEKPQKGRLREHWQFNCDIFGAPGRYGEIEILQVAVNLMESFGATNEHFEILINDRAIVDAVFERIIQADKETTYRLYKIVDKSKKVNEEAVQKMVGETNLSEEQANKFYAYLKLNNFEDVFTYLKNNDEADTAESFEGFVKAMEEMKILPYVVYDPAIVRGLDYYTGVVFEIFDKHPDNRRAICGGGAYANLLQIFNENPLAGVGFGLGDVTLGDFLETHGLLPDFENATNDLYLTFQTESALSKASELAHSLRKEGLKVVATFEPTKFKKVFKEAQKKGAKFVALIGDNELDADEVQMKNLASKEQINFKFNDISKIKDFIKASN